MSLFLMYLGSAHMYQHFSPLNTSLSTLILTAIKFTFIYRDIFAWLVNMYCNTGIPVNHKLIIVLCSDSNKQTAFWKCNKADYTSTHLCFLVFTFSATLYSTTCQIEKINLIWYFLQLLLLCYTYLRPIVSGYNFYTENNGDELFILWLENFFITLLFF